jgi:sugar phosphate isomerase/epimerase
MQLSVQLYSIRNFGDLDAQLGLVREAGFGWVESVATHALAPAEFAARLERHGLRLSSMHAGLDLVEQGRTQLVEACRLTGCPLVVMPFLAPGHRPRSAAGWRAMGERLATVGRAFAADGIRFAYHNHDWEFLHFDGKPGLEWLFGAAVAADLGWEADMGWVARAGASPQDWAARHGARIVAVHAKDVSPEGLCIDEDGWATLGRGTVPWPALFPLLRQHTRLFVFEHDNPQDARACLRDSLAFMRSQLA